MNGYEQPQETGKTKPQVFTIAEAFARQHEFLPGDHIEPLVERLGGFLQYSSVGDDGFFTFEDGSLYVEGPAAFRIRLSSFTGAERDRFTIAHELGHYVLHSNLGEKRIVAMRFGSNRVEWEANWFAAAFLMPAADFRATCVQHGNDAEAVAARYLVSPRAAQVRMQALGIAGAGG